MKRFSFLIDINTNCCCNLAEKQSFKKWVDLKHKCITRPNKDKIKDNNLQPLFIVSFPPSCIYDILKQIYMLRNPEHGSGF
jgi:hypothetical protein